MTFYYYNILLVGVRYFLCYRSQYPPLPSSVLPSLPWATGTIRAAGPKLLYILLGVRRECKTTAKPGLSLFLLVSPIIGMSLLVERRLYKPGISLLREQVETEEFKVSPLFVPVGGWKGERAGLINEL